MKTDTSIPDTELLRWRRKYPQFPGVSACVELLRRNNLRGEWTEQICHELKEHASETANELITAFHEEQDSWVQMILLSIMEEASLLVFQPLFIGQLSSENERLREYAIHGLEKLGTKEALTALWSHVSRQ